LDLFNSNPSQGILASQRISWLELKKIILRLPSYINYLFIKLLSSESSHPLTEDVLVFEKKKILQWGRQKTAYFPGNTPPLTNKGPWKVVDHT
jgi:hypothetical protein